MLKIIENGIKMPLKIPWRVRKRGSSIREGEIAIARVFFMEYLGL